MHIYVSASETEKVTYGLLIMYANNPESLSIHGSLLARLAKYENIQSVSMC